MSVIDLSGNGTVKTVGEIPPPGYNNDFADRMAAALNAGDPELDAALAGYVGGVGGATTVANITDATAEAKAFLVAVGLAAMRSAIGVGASGTHPDAFFAQAIHGHAASDITSGVLDAARLPPSSAITNVVPAGGTLASLTAPEQALITQGCFVTIATGAIYAYTGTGSKTIAGSYVLTGLTAIDWTNVLNKPSTFAAAAHATAHSSGGADPITITNLAGTLSLAKGGTGQTTQAAALNALLPSQTGNNLKVLGTNGTDASWVVQTGGAGGSAVPNKQKAGGTVSTAVTTSEAVIGSATTALVGQGAGSIACTVGIIHLQKGTGTTNVTYTARIRRGTTTAGTLIDSAAVVCAAASQGTPIVVIGYDAIGTASAQYVITIQGSAANGTVTNYAVTPFELGGGGAAAGSITYTSPLTGAVASTAQVKMNETVSTKDFGTVGDGATVADGPAIQAALDAVRARTVSDAIGGEVILPPGVYLTNVQIKVRNKTSLRALTSRSAIIKAGPSFPTSTAVIKIEDATDPHCFNSRIIQVWIDCNSVAGSIGVDLGDSQEHSGCEDVLVYNFQGVGIDGTSEAANFVLRDCEVTSSATGTPIAGIRCIGPGGACLIERTTVVGLTTGVDKMDYGIQLDNFTGSVKGAHIENVGEGIRQQASAAVDIDCVTSNQVVGGVGLLVRLMNNAIVSVRNVARGGATTTIQDDLMGLLFADDVIPAYMPRTAYFGGRKLAGSDALPEGAVAAGVGSTHSNGSTGHLSKKVSGSSTSGWRPVGQVPIQTTGATFSPDGSTATNFFYTLNGATTINAPANLEIGREYTFILLQDATGGRAITWNGAYSFPIATFSATGNTANRYSIQKFIATSATAMRQSAPQVAYAA